MFRWPIAFTPLSLGSRGRPREAVLEVTPRGAAFTLAALSHVGHPAHLALIDAYLKGQVRLTESTGIGEDSRVVATSLAAPLLAASVLGVEHLSLADVVLLPRARGTSQFADRAADGRPVFTPDSPRLLLRADGLWHWVHSAKRFEMPGCLGMRGVGLADQWHRVIAELPDHHGVVGDASAGRWPVPILAEVRAPTGEVDRADSRMVANIRMEARGQLRRESVLGQPLPQPSTLTTVPDLLSALAGPTDRRQPMTTALSWRSCTVDVGLEPEPDGYQALWLLPSGESEPDRTYQAMRDLARAVIEGLIGRPLPEDLAEPIELRLLAEDGRSTTLDVGASVVIVRNQTVFTAWVGSDGRVLLKLFPRGGMTGG